MNLIFIVCLVVSSTGIVKGLPVVFDGDYNDEFTYPTCESKIYCYGKMVDTIQMAHLYTDSKTYVDLKQKYRPDKTYELFEQFMNEHDNEPTRDDIATFVNNTFDTYGLEMDDWTPDDWTETPSFLQNVKDPTLRKFGSDINEIWKILGRKLKEDVKEEMDLYSFIWVPNPFIVPGGRFREYYYWDSYWILHGLLLSDMHHTAKGMLENFLYLVETYGHIPNGGRIYYLARSQIPLLIPMVKLYLEYSHDYDFLKDHVVTLEKEFNYWMANHTLNINYNNRTYTVAVYGDQSYGPRPESYREDKLEADFFETDKQKNWYYSEKKAGAESGWDFSSRWFIANATNGGNITNLETRFIVPVDLNAVLEWNARLLSEFNDLLGNARAAVYYQVVADGWLEAINNVLWYEETGAWLDYDLMDRVKRDYFAPSNIAPLWTGSYNKVDEGRIVPLVLNYLKAKNVVDPGGVPTTLEHTGEQWDYPNAWPPLVHYMIVGLNNTQNEEAKQLALKISEIWIRANFIGFNNTDAMFEKYDATVPGSFGGGGEYTLQVGFGWTNGVIIDLLYKYGQSLTFSENNDVITATNEVY